MGSFNLQCAITKEPIGYEDKVVQFFLEPVLNEHGNVNLSGPLGEGEHRYAISSLPVYGTYGDYGRVQRLPQRAEPKGNPLAVEIAKQLYDYDFTEHATENYNGSFAKGGGTSYLDTNTVQFVVKKEAYDAIWSEVPDRDLAELLKQGKIEEAFDGQIDQEFLDILKSLKDVNPIEFVGAAQIVRAFKQLGIELAPQTKIASQFSGDDLQLRKSMHMSLANSKKKDNTNLDTPAKYLCMVTGKALVPGEKVVAIPVKASSSLEGEGQIGHIDERSVTGMYKIGTSPIRGLVKEDGSIDVPDISNRQANWMFGVDGKPDELENVEPRDLVNTLLENDFFEEDWGRKKPLGVALISEEGYRSLNVDKRDTLKKEYAILKKAAKAFGEAADVIVKDPVQAKRILEESGVYTVDDMDRQLEYLAKDLADESRAKYKNSTIGRSFKDSFYYLASAFGEHKYDRNYFTEMLKPDNDKSPVTSWLRHISNRIIMSNDTGDINEAVDRLAIFVDEMQEVLTMVAKLDKNAIGLTAATPYQGGLTVREQHELNSKVRQPAIEASMKALREYEQECGL